jgi:DNA-binding beta-propeller fold protein YncE
MLKLLQICDTNGQIVKKITDQAFSTAIYNGNCVYCPVTNNFYCITQNNAGITVYDTAFKKKYTIDHTSKGAYYLQIAYDASDGKIWAYNKNANEIYKIDQTTTTVIDTVKNPRSNLLIWGNIKVNTKHEMYINYGTYIDKLNLNGDILQTYYCSSGGNFQLLNDSIILAINNNPTIPEIQQIAPDGTVIKSIVLSGHPLQTKFIAVQDVILLPSGNYLAFETGKYGNQNQFGGNFLMKVSPNGTWLNSFGGVRPAMNNNYNNYLYQPELISVDNRGWIYTLSGLNDPFFIETNYRLRIFSSAPILTFTPDLQFITPTLPTETRIYNLDNYRITIQNENYIPPTPYVIKKGAPSGMYPILTQDIAFISRTTTAHNKFGEFIISDYNQHKVYVVNDTSKLLRIHHVYGDDDENVKGPAGIVTDNYGNIFISDSWNNRIKITDRFGNLIANFGSEGSGNGEFSFPTGLAIDTLRNRLYVADRNNNRIQAFSITYPLKPLEKKYNETTGLGLETEESTVLVSNPVTEKIFIMSVEKIEKIQLYTLQGIQIISEKPDFNSTMYEISLPSSMQKGVYILHVQTSKSMSHHQIIKL